MLVIFVVCVYIYICFVFLPYYLLLSFAETREHLRVLCFACCLWSVGCCLWFVVGCASFVVCCLLRVAAFKPEDTRQKHWSCKQTPKTQEIQRVATSWLEPETSYAPAPWRVIIQTLLTIAERAVFQPCMSLLNFLAKPPNGNPKQNTQGPPGRPMASQTARELPGALHGDCPAFYHGLWCFLSKDFNGIE